MAGKSSASKSKTGSKTDHRTRQVRWMRIIFGVFALLLILSMVLSMVSKTN